jgi:hypothetical protein
VLTIHADEPARRAASVTFLTALTLPARHSLREWLEAAKSRQSGDERKFLRSGRWSVREMSTVCGVWITLGPWNLDLREQIRCPEERGRRLLAGVAWRLRNDAEAITA